MRGVRGGRRRCIIEEGSVLIGGRNGGREWKHTFDK
jgi:hypothetical protein